MEPVKQFVGTGEIDRFMNRRQDTKPIAELLWGAWHEINLLVGDAKELLDANRVILETIKTYDAAYSSLRAPAEVSEFAEYVSYFVKRDVLEDEAAYLDRAFNGNAVKMGKIAEEIARVLPMNTWFKHGDLAFSIGTVRETTYEAATVRWEIYITKWGEHARK